MKRDYVSTFLLFAATGFLVLFTLVVFFRSSGTTLSSFLIASIAGLAAVAISGLWLLRSRQLVIAYFFVLIGYVVRMIVGISVYIELDPGYFGGDGTYNLGHPEIELGFRAARIVFDALSSTTDFSPAFALTVLNAGDTKNPIIAWWMGAFLFASGSANAMDLAAFNAVHMSVAALGIIGLALNLGYSKRAASLSGIMTAFYPFSFISSLLWRDAIGFLFVVLAICLVSQFKLRNPATWPHLALASFFAFGHRTIYPIVILLVSFLSARAGSQKNFQGRSTVSWAVGIVTTLFISQLLSEYLFLYRPNFSIDDILERVVFLPILMLRAVLGPFPWFTELEPHMYWMRIFDYAFHTIQLAFLICIARNFRHFFHASDLGVYAFLLFFLSSLLAPGIHTAYLSIGLPFIFARIFSLVRDFWRYLLGSLMAFSLFNSLFFILGFSGMGISQSISGY